MRSSSNALATKAGLTTWKTAQSARARIIPLVLTLVLGPSGAGPCLCAGEPVPSAADPHACCAHAKIRDAGRSAATASVKPCSPTCPGTPVALALAVPANGAEHLNGIPLADAGTSGIPFARDMPDALLALEALQRRSPPHRTTVLRI